MLKRKLAVAVRLSAWLSRHLRGTLWWCRTLRGSTGSTWKQWGAARARSIISCRPAGQQRQLVLPAGRQTKGDRTAARPVCTSEEVHPQHTVVVSDTAGEYREHMEAVGRSPGTLDNFVQAGRPAGAASANPRPAGLGGQDCRPAGVHPRGGAPPAYPAHCGGVGHCGGVPGAHGRSGVQPGHAP